MRTWRFTGLPYKIPGAGLVRQLSGETSEVNGRVWIILRCKGHVLHIHPGGLDSQIVWYA